MSEEHSDASAVFYGAAIFKALDFASGGTLQSGEPEDDGLPLEVPRHRAENVEPLAAWLPDFVVTFSPAEDGFASWGRIGGVLGNAFRLTSACRKTAIKRNLHKSEAYVHVGEVPPHTGQVKVVCLKNPSLPIRRAGEASPRVRPDSAVSCGEVPPDVVKPWLMDTGCAHDLVGQKVTNNYSE